MYISEIVTTPPENISERVPLEQEVYKVFKKLYPLLKEATK